MKMKADVSYGKLLYDVQPYIPCSPKFDRINGYFPVEIQPTAPQDKVGRTAGRLSAAGSKERDYAALLNWRERNV